MVGGKNVVFHRSHRTKNGKRDHHYLMNKEYWDRFDKKFEKIIQKQEKRWKNIAI